ncbi:hypothetical protein PIB30_003675 [Stylosanthes scabra]|uniref:Uncharacterized protein n=1 Tax=Stylosanthes scabra TaxID=79078 RepID=A0ABU6Z1D8_9FABA|nr:hypothetical protein [Stylosanthes scabra]
MRRRGKGRCGHSLLGLRGRRDLSLRACPRIMCMTGARTTLTLLCRCPVTASPPLSTIHHPLQCVECVEGKPQPPHTQQSTHPTTANPWLWSSCQPSSSSMVAYYSKHLPPETAVGVERFISVWPRLVTTYGMRQSELGTSSQRGTTIAGSLLRDWDRLPVQPQTPGQIELPINRARPDTAEVTIDLSLVRPSHVGIRC